MVLEIYSIFENVCLKNIPYCKFCLKTEKDRKLVDPIYVTQFLKGLNLSYETLGDNLSICFVCEARAHTAVKFLYLVNFAKTIDSTFRGFAINKTLQNAIKKPTQANEKLWCVRDARDTELHYKAVRTYSQIELSDTLIIDTLEDIQLHKDDFKSFNKRTSSQIETVTLDDDDDDDETNKASAGTKQPVAITTDPKAAILLPKLVPLNELLNPSGATGYIGTSVVMTKSYDANYCLFPIIGTEQGPEVPLLSAKLVNGQLAPKVERQKVHVTSRHPVNSEHVCSLAGNRKTAGAEVKGGTQRLGHPRSQSSSANINEKLNNILKASSDIFKLDDLIYKVEKQNKDKNMKRDGVVKRRKKEDDIEKDSVVVNNSAEVNLVTQPNSDDEPEVGPIRVENGTIVLNDHLPEHTVKVALEKTNSRIDWEDKIPMDVISFVDSQVDNVILVDNTSQTGTQHQEGQGWHQPVSQGSTTVQNSNCSNDPLTDYEKSYHDSLNKKKNVFVGNNNIINTSNLGVISNVVSISEEADVVYCIDD